VGAAHTGGDWGEREGEEGGRKDVERPCGEEEGGEREKGGGG